MVDDDDGQDNCNDYPDHLNESTSLRSTSCDNDLPLFFAALSKASRVCAVMRVVSVDVFP
jgi:hypothetical protein